MSFPAFGRALAAIGVVGLLGLSVPAISQTEVRAHARAHERAIRELRRERAHHRRQASELRGRIGYTRRSLELQIGREIDHRTSIEAWAQLRRQQGKLGWITRTFRRRAERLVRRRDANAAWLARYAVFDVCPVPAFTYIHDDFGEIVDMPGVKKHVHTGNDVQAPYGTRIVAPFAGRAVASSSELGGLQVRVYGARGYVYNAHLSAYGRLGAVRAGDTIGYIGSTGDSTAPHDHIEWHPGSGGAVDTYLYLALSCYAA